MGMKDPDPIILTEHYQIMVVPISSSMEPDYSQARPATLVDLARAGVPLEMGQEEEPES